MKPFDNYEISPCTRTEEPDKPGHFYFEVCVPHEADVWTLYGHLPEGGVEAIGDFATREHAEQVFQRITGIPFADTKSVRNRLRVMHAGQSLLESLQSLAEHADEDCPHGYRSRHLVEALVEANEVIAEATGRAA
ncbi:hypothetical protein J8F10_09190 [Gemmata sp. G18]|uniref:Uncharacterized protein n=1 Tax=Gemmata palustris TaxID=2822762 RepID=A0ABS5BP64_9BACT|nr:hypothetical protein [Gemmata palustris]MBP3955455.1 hypothetical protein [Gemmata palustris]